MSGDAIADASWSISTAALFEGLPASTLAQLAAAAQQVSYHRGAEIFRQGDSADALYLLEAGHIKASVRSESGREAIIAILGPGECLGELALIDGRPRSATVTTLTDVQAVALARDGFSRVVRQNVQVLERLLVILCQRLRRTDELAAELALLDIPGRLAQTLLALASTHGEPTDEGILIAFPTTQGELGAMTGASRAAVNRVIQLYERQKLIKRLGQRIIIVHPERLSRRVN